MPEFLITWLIATVALMVTAYIVPGFFVANIISAAIASVILGLVNAIIKPLLVVLTLPLTLLTFGLFLFVINAIVILLAGRLTPGFVVSGFVPALVGSIVLTLITSGLTMLVGKRS
ncbi:phage holin family protein [Synechocystis sp. PCC 7509]|uniref:phage holin family protein n=1 Tax=Synechocystis sp. PCC 7509 TaxID=927677 RepID=UPI0002AB9D30|nr:phage holin family protein [Synechocystis sp. PCC 7509]